MASHEDHDATGSRIAMENQEKVNPIANRATGLSLTCSPPGGIILMEPSFQKSMPTWFALQAGRAHKKAIKKMSGGIVGEVRAEVGKYTLLNVRFYFNIPIVLPD